MVTESRVAKSVHNIKIALLFYVLNLLIQFVYRKIFLDHLGSEVLGLNTTAQNLLGFLNIAELGIGSAVAYNLYKPLYDKNTEDINAIVSIQGWLYRRIATIVIIGAIVLMFFFPLIFAKADLPLWYPYGAFIALLTSSLLSYFVNYKQIVLSADQKEYKVTTCVQGVKLIKIAIQLLAIYSFENGYLWWIIIEILMAFVTSLILNKTISHEYPWLTTNVSQGNILKNKYPEILRKTKQIFFHKIGSFVMGQTSTIIIYAFTSLTMVAIYGNYLLVISGMTLLVNSVFNSMDAGIGNLVAEGDKKKIKSVYWQITVLRIWIASMVCYGLYILSDRFITLWVGSEYILPHSTLIVLIINTFLGLIRNNDSFINAYGLYSDIWAPIIEATLNLSLSIILGYYLGLPGVLMGVCISLFIVIHCWKPYFLYKFGFKENWTEYALKYIKYFTVITLSFIVCCFFFNKYIVISNASFIDWALYAIIMMAIYCVISFLLFYSSDNSFRKFIKRITIKHYN